MDAEVQEVALTYLDMRACSLKELERYLLRKFPAKKDAVMPVVLWCKAQGFIDDITYATRIANSFGNGKKGSRKTLIGNLSKKGIARSDIAHVMEKVAIDEQAPAYRTAAKKLVQIDHKLQRDIEQGKVQLSQRQVLLVRKQRLIGFLARHGYSKQTIETVVSNLLHTNPLDE